MMYAAALAGMSLHLVHNDFSFVTYSYIVRKMLLHSYAYQVHESPV